MDGVRSTTRTRLSRRVFVRTASGLLVLPWLRCGGAHAARHDPGSDASADGPPDAADHDDRDAAVRPDAALDAGPPPSLCEPFLTPVSDFPRLYGGNGTVDYWQRPMLDSSTHRLSIEGLVQDPHEVSLAELEADVDHHVRVVNTLQCVMGYRGTAIWTGVPLRVLLERAGLLRDEARRVHLIGADGFYNNLRIEDLYQPPPETFEPLVAFRMNDAPLDATLGAPARVLLCDRYGFKNTKWVATIEVTDSDEEYGQYQRAGLSDDRGEVAANARLGGEGAVAAGSVTLCGHGMSGAGGIERVQVSIDGQPYERARLLSLDEVVEATPAVRDTLQFRQPEAFPWPYRGVWAPFEHTVELAAGEHQLSLGVVDRAGSVVDGFNFSLTAS